MRIYFSGGRGLKCTPEVLVPELKPHIMLTFHDIGSNGTIDRLNSYLDSIGHKLLKRTGKQPFIELPKNAYTETMFMDSGAFSLYNIHILSKKKGRWPKAEDFESYYTLEPGSDFRKYCDNYAKWMKRLEKAKMLWTTVDAIRGPEKSWEIQQYLEKEHGLNVIPVIHAGTEPVQKYLDRYIETGHTLIGLGGLGQKFNANDYAEWANKVYAHICPASNGYKPVVRTHGFAMTSSELIQRYPWWSVDSATWVKLAAYGWLYVPRRRGGVWNFNEPPIQFNVSAHSPIAQKHFRFLEKTQPTMIQDAREWLAELGMDFGSVDLSPKEKIKGMHTSDSFTLADIGKLEVEEDFEEDSLSGHFRNRSRANLYFLKRLEQSRPKWPYPLRADIYKAGKRQKTFGFV